MQSELDSRALLLMPSAKTAPMERTSTAQIEPDAGSCWEGSRCVDPWQLESALHLAALDTVQTEAVELSQAAAVSMTGAQSKSPDAEIAAGVAAAADGLLSCTVDSAFICIGIVTAAAAAAAAGEHRTMAVPSPLTGTAGVLSRRDTGPAGNATLRRLPRAARLLRIEALVRLSVPRWRPCQAPLECRPF
jgi:hypothetical protein